MGVPILKMLISAYRSIFTFTGRASDGRRTRQTAFRAAKHRLGVETLSDRRNFNFKDIFNLKPVFSHLDQTTLVPNCAPWYLKK